MNKRNNDIDGRDSISLIDFIIVVSKHMNILVSSILIFPSLALVYIFFFNQHTYRSTSKIISSSQSSSIRSQALGIASQFGLNIPSMNSEGQKWVYKDMLKSRMLAKSMLKKKFYTNAHAEEKTLLEILTYSKKPQKFTSPKLELIAMKTFNRMVTVSEDIKTNIFTVNVTASEPELASELNSALIGALDDHQKKYNKSKTNEARVFIEGRITETKKELNLAEEKLKDFRIRNRRITNSPSLLMEEERLVRETAVLTGVFTTLKQQLENTKIEEVKDQDYVIFIDKPDIPLRASGASKISIFLFSLVFGVVFGIAFTFIYEYYSTLKAEELKSIEQIKMNAKKSILSIYSRK